MSYYGMFDKVSQSLFTSILHAYNKLKCKKSFQSVMNLPREQFKSASYVVIYTLRTSSL